MIWLSVLAPPPQVAAHEIRVVGFEPAGDITERAAITSRNPGANRSIWASMRATMSMSDPLGTWQYAHAVWRPAGARDESNSNGWTTSTNGRSLGVPFHADASEATISSRVPLTWTVAACATIGSRHGIGAASAQSTLNAPGP